VAGDVRRVTPREELRYRACARRDGHRRRPNSSASRQYPLHARATTLKRTRPSGSHIQVAVCRWRRNRSAASRTTSATRGAR
jgi:hypothetical protein